VSPCSQFPEHLFGIDKTTILNVFLRGQERTVEGGTVIRVEPVARIERQEYRHARRVPRAGLARQYAPWIRTETE
jgi:hypothetical protein